MGNEYSDFFGSYAVYLNRQIIDVCDLDERVGEPYEGDEAGTCVKCGNCDCWMVHKKTSWKCPECGAVVSHSKVYDAIQDKNLEFYRDEEDYEDYY